MKIISIRKLLRADIRYSTILADRQPFQKIVLLKYISRLWLLQSCFNLVHTQHLSESATHDHSKKLIETATLKNL